MSSRTTFETLHDARWRAVGTRFLRHRPWIAALGALGNGAIGLASDTPRPQLAAMGGSAAVLVVAFAAEALVLRRRPLHARWLATSLWLTALAIGGGCALGGGLESPMLPLLFAPVTVGLAAFGRGRASVALGLLAVAILAALAIAPLPWPPLPAPQRAWMIAWSTLASLALTGLGVTGLVEAYRSVGRSLDRMRSEVIDEAARRARDQETLGANVAHELRNPLTAVKGLVQMLAKRPSQDPRDARRLEVILGEVERVERTLEEYLSLARPLADLATVSLPARALIDGVAEIVEGRASARSVRVACSGDAGEVVADPRRVREALLNLAQNAIEAMPHGGSLAMSVSRDGDRVVIAVCDDGEGMSPEILARAGTRFATGREGGSGLGLALARSVARQHGGELQIESAPGAGTTVRMVLPGTGGSGAE